MKSIENTFELKRNAVIASPSSIFSKVDVITMLEELQAVVLNLLEEAKEEAKDIDLRENVLQQFRVELDDNRYGSYIDIDSAEFNINYDNRIELQNIEIEADEITSALERAFDRVQNGN
jgi:5-enolpyruvylshikimate-3-phosphate synthase